MKQLSFGSCFILKRLDHQQMVREFKITQDLQASQGERVLHYIIDLVVQYCIIFGLGILAAIIAGILQSNAVLNWLDNVGDGVGYLIFFAVSLLYYGIMETCFSRTIAKFITRTIVVMEDGSKPDGMTILKRSFCRLIPFDALSYLCSGRGWHDTIPNVYVVKKAAFEQSRELFHAFQEIGENKIDEV